MLYNSRKETRLIKYERERGRERERRRAVVPVTAFTGSKAYTGG
jgi:hypothetical protein